MKIKPCGVKSRGRKSGEEKARDEMPEIEVEKPTSRGK